MKYKILSAMLLLAAGLAAAMKMDTNKKTVPPIDENGHVLTALWKQYDAATRQDKPQTRLKLLENICEQAMAGHYSVDFYDGVVAIYEVGVSRNWKLRDSLRTALLEDVEAYREAVVTFRYRARMDIDSETLLDYVVAHYAQLFHGRTEAFYRSLAGIMDGVLPPFVQDDYEYALWQLRGHRAVSQEQVDSLLGAYLGDRYPNAGILEFVRMDTSPRHWTETQPWRDKLRGQMQAFREKYAGKALALHAEAYLLEDEFQQLNEQPGTSSDRYKAFYRKCQDFEARRSAFTGEEAQLVAQIQTGKDLLAALNERSLRVTFRRDKGIVYFRNLTEAELRLSDPQGKTVLQQWKLKNKGNSFYAYDSLSVALPDRLNDGSWQLAAENKAEKLLYTARYEQYTLSLALRYDEQGARIYVTDYQSGKPLDEVRVILESGGKTLVESMLRLKGFTLLPAEMQRYLRGNGRRSYTLRVEKDEAGYLRASPSLYTGYYRADFSAMENGRWVKILKDRGAYHPGDSLQFKLICYGGDRVRQLQAQPGVQLVARLFGADGKEIASLPLTTGEYGSAAGTFALPQDGRNGSFRLSVYENGQDQHALASDYFRVDEYVLPTFQLAFDPSEEVYVSGDTIHCRGQLSSYSGHSLSEARIRAEVSHYDDRVYNEEIRPRTDGSFALDFLASESGTYSVRLQVVDPSGETWDFYRHYYVSDDFSISIDVLNAADADLAWPSTDDGTRENPWEPQYVITEPELHLKLSVQTDSGEPAPVPVRYSLRDVSGHVLVEGESDGREAVHLALPGQQNTRYYLKAQARLCSDGGRVVEREESASFLGVLPDRTQLDCDVKRLFLSSASLVGSGEDIQVRMGTTEGEIWAVATLFGENRSILENRFIHFTGRKGTAGALQDLRFAYKPSYPDAVRLQLFYFKDGEAQRFEREYTRERKTLDLPLTWSRFEDKTRPGSRYTFSLKTEAGVEAAVAVYDKSLDAIAPNFWSRVQLSDFHVPSPQLSSLCGHVREEQYEALLYNSVVTRSGGGMRLMAKAMAVEEDASVEAESDLMIADSSIGVAPTDIPVREVFSEALTFQPFLRSGEDGDISFSFSTSDKLSTYYVAVFAHDTSMRNASLVGETVVSLPVKLALQEPRILYSGDRYDLSCTLSSLAEQVVEGRLYLELTDGRSHQLLMRADQSVQLAAGGVSAATFPIELAGFSGPLGVKLSFVSQDFSDAVYVEIPVEAAEQRLQESHSAVLLPGADREALIASLRGQFVNADAASAELREISIRDMLTEAIPEHVDPQAEDVLSLTEAWYVRRISAALGADLGGTSLSDTQLMEKMLACRNVDGGFGWFPGFRSSPVITAVVLERMALLRDRGVTVPDMESSVRYLDNTHFSTSLPYWCGALSDEQYLFVRSMYACYDFRPKAEGDKVALRKIMTNFKKQAVAYLTPSRREGRGLNAQILAKARRILILQRLLDTEDGLALARVWGIKGLTASQLTASVRADYASLLEYAVEHRDGGWYYPNAVMPLRGLLENEAYAHTLLCRLMDRAPSGIQASGPRPEAISRGIRLWLMLQKETQHWDAEPAFVDAIDAILKDPAVLDTRVLVLSGTQAVPLRNIRKAGNGFTLERSLSLLRGDRIYEWPVGDGADTLQLQVGDRIRVQYRIWNAENRSFVRLSAPREGALRPVDQLSGYYGWGFRPLRISAYYSLSPQGYRNVKADRTEYYFDTFPEETTVVEEEFFVTQAGRYAAPVAVIESLYAPHYRANGAYTQELEISGN